MKLLTLHVLWVVLSAGLLMPPGVQVPRATRVLFVGNSYTFFNNLPEMVRALAQAAGAGDVQTRMIATGAGRLADHWERGEARTALTGSAWDFVVLQEQSTLGIDHRVDGQARVSSDRVFAPAAAAWAKEVTRVGGRPVFYLTWARKAAPDDQPLLNAAYAKAARAGGGLLAPVGIAWSHVRERAPEIELFAGDGSHPSPAGSYLAACVLVAAIFGKSPEGLPARIVGPPVDVQTGSIEAGQTAVLVDLPPAHARVLQTSAWLAVRQALIGANGNR